MISRLLIKFGVLVFLFSTISCKSVKKSGDYNVVVGIAGNTKGGAVLRDDDKTYKIEGLQSWDRLYLNKKVRVKGIVEFMNVEDYKKSENPLLNSLQGQALNSNYYSVSKATWELYESDDKD